MTGTLLLCATPIGNLGDASPRLAETLAAADVVFAEDTRRARILLDHLGVSARLESYFAGNESKRAGRLEALLQSGATVALITDAGMPSISDPGVSAVRVARELGAAVSVVPGASASLAALAVSGLPAERFVFEGFLPRKGSERSERLADLKAESRTIVVFCAKNRVVEDLSALGEALGDDRAVTVARELTKIHEEIWAGTLRQAVVEWTSRPPRGEFTLVIAGRPPASLGLSEAVLDVMARVSSGDAMSDAVRTVADSLGVRRRALYEAVLHAPD